NTGRFAVIVERAYLDLLGDHPRSGSRKSVEGIGTSELVDLEKRSPTVSVGCGALHWHDVTCKSRKQIANKVLECGGSRLECIHSHSQASIVGNGQKPMTPCADVRTHIKYH